MLSSIARIIQQFKQSWCAEIDDAAIEQAVQETGHVWRDRELNPLTTIRLVMLQILFGNAACNHVPHLAGKDVTGSAYCQARRRLPLAALEKLLARCTKMMGDCLPGTERWLGHRLFLMDGSSFSMSDTPELREHFGQPGGQQPGCGFPTAHLLALVHAGCGLVQRAIAGPLRTHDLPAAPQCHPALAAGDVVAGDRAFCSYAHLALLLSQGIFVVLRMHQKQIVDFTPARAHVAPGQHLKTTMKMDVLRCQTVDGAIKELTMFLLVYNLIRMVQLQAARQQGVSVDRISFIDALRWLATARPEAKPRRLVVNPQRPGRYEPRCKKRRPKQYDLVNKPRAVLRQKLAPQSLTP